MGVLLPICVCVCEDLQVGLNLNKWDSEARGVSLSVGRGPPAWRGVLVSPGQEVMPWEGGPLGEGTDSETPYEPRSDRDSAWWKRCLSLLNNNPPLQTKLKPNTAACAGVRGGLNHLTRPWGRAWGLRESPSGSACT